MASWWADCFNNSGVFRHKREGKVREKKQAKKMWRGGKRVGSKLDEMETREEGKNRVKEDKEEVETGR